MVWASIISSRASWENVYGAVSPGRLGFRRPGRFLGGNLEVS